MINRLFKNKFKLRIVHFAKQDYAIEYAYYKFIPKYKKLYQYHDIIERFLPVLYPFDKMTYFAEKFNNISDVNSFIEKEILKCNEHREKLRMYHIKNVPYIKKQII